MVFFFFFKIRDQTWEEEKSCRELGFYVFRVRRCAFSLKSRVIQPSNSFDPRRKAVLREEDNSSTPILGTFDKLREVGVSSHLFYSWFKCFVDVCVGLRL